VESLTVKARSARAVGVLLAALAAGALQGCGAPAPEEPIEARIARIEEGLLPPVLIAGREATTFTLQERMEHYSVPGVSVAVIDDYQVAWAKGYGVADVVTGAPVTTETLFQAASISKPVAAMGMLKLVEEGHLTLDDNVNSWLTVWRLPENDYTAREPVTLRRIVTHTAGLTVHGFPGYAVTAPLATTVQVLDSSGPANTAPIRVDTVPGSIYRYSGGGYTVMQRLMTEVTGRDFPDLLQELVLGPAGMDHSSYLQPLPPEREVRAASGHLQDGSRVDGEWHIYPEAAAAGLWTTPTDLASLAVEVQKSLRGESNRILSREMTRRMLSPMEPGGHGLGFGLSRPGEGDARFGHGGSNHGFKCTLQAFVEGGQGVAIMTNGDLGSALAQEVLRAVAAEYGWEGMGPDVREVVQLSPDQLAAFEGAYELVGVDLTVTLKVEGDHLVVEVPGDVPHPLYPSSETEFFDATDGASIEFTLREDGRATEFQVRGGPRGIRIRR
jgi:CubicO group peptidase (beta-lactamase class C family)